MPPFRQAVRFVKHPTVDLALRNGVDEAGITELFGRDKQDADVAQGGFVQDFGAFHHFHQAVEHGRAGDAFFLQAVQLVFHQRLQRRYDHRQAAVAVVAVERGQLVAQGFAAASGQHRQRVQPLHTRLHHGALSAFKAFHAAKRGQPEMPFQLGIGVERVLAIAAFRAAAIVVAQFGNQPSRIGKLMPHPRCQHGVAARHVQPRQGIAEGRIYGRIADVCFHQLRKARTADFQTALVVVVLHHQPNGADQPFNIGGRNAFGNSDAV